MAALRLGVGLDDEPQRKRRDSCDTDNTFPTAEWSGSAGPSAGPSFTFQPEPSTSPAGYRDLRDFRDFLQLHQGRHSTVWSAVCRRTGKTVVIKGYNRETLKARQLNNVRREVGLLRSFRDSGCKGVVSMLAVFEDKAVIYLVFEACLRGDLYQLLMRNRGTLHEEFVVTKIVFPLLCVLQEMHKLHVVHRDIKPENIFITEDGDIALGDFGLAAHKFQDRLTERVGTLDYMAPEVLSIPVQDEQQDDASIQPYDEKVDIWAVGVLVYELLVGRPPFEVEDPEETARLIMNGDVTKYPVHISQYARDFIAQALRKSPAERPAAADLVHHPWLSHYFGGKVPDPASAMGGGVTAGMVKSWLMSSWNEVPKSGALKPAVALPNRVAMSPVGSPRKACGTADVSLQPRIGAQTDDDMQTTPQCKRKSVPGSSEPGSDSQREQRKFEALPLPLVGELGSQLSVSLGGGGRLSSADRDGGVNRLTASQYPSRDSSAGSMDQAVPLERAYVRNDSGASASSSISIASFASLQHVPRSAGAVEVVEADELGMVQRSVSVCVGGPGGMVRPPVGFPGGGSAQLKPVWQSGSGSVTASGAAGGAGKKTPGKSRFAA